MTGDPIRGGDACVALLRTTDSPWRHGADGRERATSQDLGTADKRGFMGEVQRTDFCLSPSREERKARPGDYFSVSLAILASLREASPRSHAALPRRATSHGSRLLTFPSCRTIIILKRPRRGEISRPGRFRSRYEKTRSEERGFQKVGRTQPAGERRDA